MEFRDVLFGRRSTRAFSGRGISTEEIRLLLKAAIHAPNACNAQSWRFYAVTDPEIKAKFASEKICAPWVADAPVVFVLCTDSAWLQGRFGDRAEMFVIQDTALAAGNMLLTAADMGLGGCIIGAFDEEKCRTLLEIPENLGVTMLLPIGEPSGEIPARARKTVDAVTVFVGADSGVPDEKRRVPFVLRGTSLPGAQFDDLNLIGANIDHVNLAESKFRHVTLRAAQLIDCDLSGMTIDGISVEEAIAFYKENKK